MNRLPIAALTALLAFAAAAPARAQTAPSQDPPLRNIDVRKADGGPVDDRRAARARASSSARSATRAPSRPTASAAARGWSRAPTASSPAAARRPPADIALEYVRASALPSSGSTSADLDRLRLTRRYRSVDGVTHLAYVQTYEGIAAYDNVLLANVDDDGRLVNVGGAAVDGLRVDTVDPDLDAGDALAAAKTRGRRRARRAARAPGQRPGAPDDVLQRRQRAPDALQRRRGDPPRLAPAGHRRARRPLRARASTRPPAAC